MMMTMGEGAHHKPGIHAPPWTLFDDPSEGMAYRLPVSGVTGGGASGDCSPYVLGEAALAALQRYLPSNEAYDDSDESELADAPVDAYSCDEFRMYEFKVRRCARGRSHDWTECPYAHPGEKARRRDPRKYHYSGTACPDFRKGNCKRGDACEYAHGVFECWLHPARYRTQPCKDGTACRRRVCFFAHTPEQLRVLPQQQQQQMSPRAAAPESYDGSPLRRHSLDAYFPSSLMSSPSSPPMSPPSDSPPMSPSGVALRRASWPAPGSAMNEVLVSLRQLQLSKVNSMPSSWGLQMGGGGGGGLFGSPRASGFRAGFCSLPSTPTRAVSVGGGARWLEGLEGSSEEEPVERVESGRALRAKMFERLSVESGLEKLDAAAAPAPDVGWVSELVK